VISVSTAAEYASAMVPSNAGATIVLAADITNAASGRTLPDGATLDLAGHTLNVTSGADLHGLYLGTSWTVKSGTLILPRYGLWNWVGCTAGTFQDLYLRGAVTAIKTGANGSTVTAANVTIQRVDILASNVVDLTVVDLGPGIVDSLTITDLNIVRPAGGNQTAADGVGIEHATGYVHATRVYIEGAAGDGFDCKNLCDASIVDVQIGSPTVQGAARNGIKLWGKGKAKDGSGSNTTTTVTRVAAYDTGVEALTVEAGIVNIADSFARGISSTANFGNGTDQPTPNVYGKGQCTVTVTNSVFTRKTTQTSLLCSLNGGDSRAVTYDSTVDFTDCGLWNPNHDTILGATTAYGGTYPGQTKSAALAGHWQSNFHNCTVGDESAPRVTINPPNPPNFGPAPVVAPSTADRAATTAAVNAAPLSVATVNGTNNLSDANLLQIGQVGHYLRAAWYVMPNNAGMQAAGLKPLAILMSSQYDLRSPDGIAAFAAECASVAGTFMARDAGSVFEIFNEPHRSYTMAEYHAFAEPAVAAIKAAHPEAFVIVGGGLGDYLALTAEGLVADYVAAGGGHYGDALSIHTFTPARPEEWRTRFTAIQALVPELPLCVTEWDTYMGQTNGEGGTQGDDDSRAAYAVRQNMMALEYGMPFSNYFMAKDDASVWFDTVGLLTGSSVPRTSWTALRTMRTVLAGCTYEGRPTTAENVTAHRFQKVAGSRTTVIDLVWHDTGSGTYAPPAGAVCTACDGTESAPGDTITIGILPQFLSVVTVSAAVRLPAVTVTTPRATVVDRRGAARSVVVEV
jgi:hypothetical protein